MTKDAMRSLPKSITRACSMVEFHNLDTNDLKMITINHSFQLSERNWIAPEIIEILIAISEKLQKKKTGELTPSHNIRGVLRVLDLYDHVITSRSFDKEGEIDAKSMPKVLFRQLEFLFLGADKVHREFVLNQLNEMREKLGMKESNNRSKDISLELKTSCRFGDVFLLKTPRDNSAKYQKIASRYALKLAQENLFQLASALQSSSLVILSGKPGTGRTSTVRFMAAFYKKIWLKFK